MLPAFGGAEAGIGKFHFAPNKPGEILNEESALPNHKLGVRQPGPGGFKKRQKSMLTTLTVVHSCCIVSNFCSLRLAEHLSTPAPVLASIRHWESQSGGK
jgi:hypothetical protein